MLCVGTCIFQRNSLHAPTPQHATAAAPVATPPVRLLARTVVRTNQLQTFGKLLRGHVPAALVAAAPYTSTRTDVLKPRSLFKYTFTSSNATWSAHYRMPKTAALGQGVMRL